MLKPIHSRKKRLAEEKKTKDFLETQRRKASRKGKLFREIKDVVNKYGKDNDANTPDYILANYLMGCLEVFERTMKEREDRYAADRVIEMEKLKKIEMKTT